MAAAVLVLVALGAFVAGLVEDSTELTWAAFAMSVLAGVVLAAEEVRRRRAGAAQRARSTPSGTGSGPARTVGPGGGAAGPSETVLDEDPPVRRVSPPPVPPSSPDLYGTGRRSRTEGTDDSGSPDGWRSPSTGTGRAGRAGPPVVPPELFPGDPGDLLGGPVPVRPTAPTAGAAPVAPRPGTGARPPVEDVEMTDFLMVLDLTDEVLVADQQPRYHLERCPHLLGHPVVGLRIDEARAQGFTPCSTCGPIRMLAARERARRSV